MMTSDGIDFIPDNPTAGGGIDFIPDQAGSSGGFLSSTNNSPGVQAILGAGDTLRNTLAGAANLTGLPQLLHGTPLSLAHTGSGTAYNIGNIAGNVGGFLGGGELLDAARAGAEAIPFAGNAMQWLGGNGLAGVARRALGTAGYGAANNPSDPGFGALLGAGTSGAADAVPGVANWINKGVQYFQPQKYAQDILDSLGNGQTLPEVTKSAINNINNAYKAQRESTNAIYNPVLDAVGDNPIYNKQVAADPTGYGIIPPVVNPDTTISYNGGFPNLSSNVMDNLSPALKDLSNDFLQNPTFKNAHNLQSKLGIKIGRLSESKNAQDAGTQNQLEASIMARDTIKNDMFSFLNRFDPSGELGNQYQKASDYFLSNVIPYRSNPIISKFATGKLTNYAPSSFANIFKAPSESVNKVLSDLSPETINNIFYTKLGQRVPSSSPEAMVRNFGNFQQQGLSEFSPQSLSEQMKGLQNRINARNALQSAGTALLGAKLGGIEGALGGLALGKPIMGYLSSKLPINQAGDYIAQGLSGAYPYARNIALANILANQGGQQ